MRVFPAMSDPVNKATGESVSGLVWMVAGAAAVAVFLAPLVSRYLGISATLALILGGVALAYFAKGGLRKAGQGAAVFGIASWAMTLLGPLFASINPFGQKTAARDAPSGVRV